MNIEDHPDLRNLRLSKRDERRARAVARAREREERAGIARRERLAAGEPSLAERYRTRLVVIGVFALIVVGGVLVASRARPDVTTTAPPTTGTVMDERPGVDLSQPFLGTPAVGWPDGAAGIVPPAAAQVGSYSPQAVAAGYERVRQLLITARLDRAVLEGHDYQRYLAQLAPNAKAQVEPKMAAGAGQGVATRVAGGFHLLPVEPKVSGSMWAEQDPEGALLIHTNYVFAYAFDPAGAEVTQPMDIVTVLRQDADFLITDTRWPAADRGLWPSTAHGFGYSIACAAYQRGELAPGFSERHSANGAAPDDRDKAFDPKAPIPAGTTCPT